MRTIRLTILPALLSVAALAQTRIGDTAAPPPGSFQSVVHDLKPSIPAPNILAIEGGRCWGVTKPRATATITAGTGSGSYVAYCTDTQTIVIEHAASAGMTINCSGCTQIQVATPTVPEGLYKIADGIIDHGKFASVIDQRDFMTGHRHLNGAGMNTQCAAGVCVDQVDSATLQLKTENYTPTAKVDAAAATMTRPFRMGAELSATCQPGEFFYQTGAPAGRRLHECIGANQWSLAVAQTPGTMMSMVTTYFPATAVQSMDALSAGNNRWKRGSLNAALNSPTLKWDPLPTAPATVNFHAKAASAAYVTTTAPPSWDGGLQARLFLERDKRGAQGNWKLEVAVSCSGADDRYLAGEFNKPATAVIPAAGTPRILPVQVTKLDTASCRPGDLVAVQVRRAGTDAADTSPDALRLLGLELSFRTE